MGMIRLLLAVGVVVYHLPPDRTRFSTLLDGARAVEVFFVISGFYMSLILTDKYNPGTGPGWWRRFYAARFVRLYPAFAAVSLAGLGQIAAGYAYGTDPCPLARELFARLGAWSALVALSDLTMVGQDVLTLFRAAPDGTLTATFGSSRPEAGVWLAEGMLIQPAWSIGTEVWFYLLAPWVVRRAAVTWAVFSASLALKVWMETGLGVNSYYFFPAQCCLFLAGALAHRYGRTVPKARLVAAGRVLLPLTLAGFATGRLWITPAVAPFVAPAFAVAVPPIFAVSSRWRWDRVIGELSYPVYLVHLLVISTLAMVFKRVTGAPPDMGSVLVATLLVATALHLLVERPAERFRQRFARPDPAPDPAAGR